MVIINLRGTSGSGKSHVVRRLVAHYKQQYHMFEDGRRQPLSTLHFNSPHLAGSLFVPGHYETPCGGCDTIKTPDRVYELVRTAIVADWNVIYEGIIVQDDTRRLLELNAEHPVHVIELSTSLEACLLGIQERRDARGDTRTLNPKNTQDRAVRVHKICDKLRAQGLAVPILGREEAYTYCLELLRR